MSDTDPLSGAYCKPHDIYLCSECEAIREANLNRGLAGAMAQVRDFFVKFGVPIEPTPNLPFMTIQRLRRRLIREEFEEFEAAWNADDLVEIADALADMVYVILGTALAYGIPLAEVFDEVHRSNMRKVGGATREDGKVMKPENWIGPDVAGILERAK